MQAKTPKQEKKPGQNGLHNFLYDIPKRNDLLVYSQFERENKFNSRKMIKKNMLLVFSNAERRIRINLPDPDPKKSVGSRSVS